MNRPSLVLAASAASLIVYAGCGSDDPSSASPTITAPTPQTPTNGASVNDPAPTLTVANASGADGLLYRFEVASDASFTNVVATTTNVPQGSGTTSWTVAPALTSGTFHWRARASANGTDGPFSSVASFELDAGFFSPTPINNILVSDPLTNGMTVGERGNGDFRPGGWFTQDPTNYIRYTIPPTPNGFVEFDVIGLRNPNPGQPHKRNLMIMWDPTAGDYTENPFRVHIAKFDTRLVNRWHLRLRFISNREETNTGINKFDWNPRRIYNFRLEWGRFPAVTTTQRARVLLDGQPIMVRNYDNVYRPNQHVVELGMAPRFETLELVTFSNVVIGVRRPNLE